DKGYDETKPISSKISERKEFKCRVVGVEIKETEEEYHVSGLIATTHLDDSDLDYGMKDYIPKETLESFANQVNSLERARIMGVHHSEGRPINAEYYGVADVETTPAEVISLTDGEHGLFVDTKLLKNDPRTPEIIERFENGDLNSFSITYDTQGFTTTDFEYVGGELVRSIGPNTRLFGYTSASNPVNSNAIAMDHGFKEFKELIRKNKNKEVITMTDKKVEVIETKEEAQVQDKVEDKVDEKVEESKSESDDTIEESSEESVEEKELKEFRAYKAEKLELEAKEKVNKQTNEIIKGVVDNMEKKEKVLASNDAEVTISLERKAFREVLTTGKSMELKEQFRRAAGMCDELKINWEDSYTSKAESREYKHFGIVGNQLEFKGLGLTTNQNTDTDYLQSTAELNDIYDPIIYNAINQSTDTWNVLSKDDYSSKGNNMVQFKLKIAANASATYYLGNSVATDNVGRLKYQTAFKKAQVGVTVDGDMIAAARGSSTSDVFAQEVNDSVEDLMAVINASVYDEVGLETVAEPIGFEYITDSAGNTTMYGLTRSSANKLAPDSASDTYINGNSAIVSQANLRAAIRQAEVEGAKRKNLVFFTHQVQADLYKGKFDDATRFLTSKDTNFGFKANIFVDEIPVFTDKDCNTDDWFLVDTETHRVAIWVPPTLERLGKTADSEDAFV
ncbi:MAG: hypothetical protein H7647_02570, partial [Candidatus Heimdallarchaeota archaeon]|nr:hypothetical protein [Candidatus Heimdallarchaeota archaeon]MCK4253313.1 hypothetical protein [Candidatus Heimdallarchaeota archaeon]